MNDDVLSESTDRDFSFEYIDISNVSEGHIADDVQEVTFGAAPSRARRLARPGDVLVSTVRTYLRAIAQVGENNTQRVYSTGFAVLRPIISDTDPRYVAYVLTSNQVMDEIVATSSGVSYPAISGTALHRIHVPHNSLDTQKRIADYLDRETGEIDAMLARMDELTQTLEARRSHAIRVAVTGFPSAALGYYCRIFNGSTPLRSRADYWAEGDGYPWLNSSAVNVPVVISAPRSVSPKAMRECHLPEVHVDDILMGITGQGRTRGMVAMAGINCTISQHVAAIRPVSGWHARFLYLALSAEYRFLRDRSEGGGSTKGAITCEMLAQYRVSRPPIDEQKRIADHLDEVTGRIDQMLAKTAELKNLLIERRAALITDVVTGKKQVP